jgi:hypothetical protein
MFSFDITTVTTIIACMVTTIGFIYAFLRNFKSDINAHLDKMEKRLDKMESRIDTLEERMFWLATGKKLEDAILEEKMKLKEKKQ